MELFRRQANSLLSECKRQSVSIDPCYQRGGGQRCQDYLKPLVKTTTRFWVRVYLRPWSLGAHWYVIQRLIQKYPLRKEWASMGANLVIGNPQMKMPSGGICPVHVPSLFPPLWTLPPPTVGVGPWNYVSLHEEWWKVPAQLPPTWPLVTWSSLILGIRDSQRRPLWRFQGGRHRELKVPVKGVTMAHVKS